MFLEKLASDVVSNLQSTWQMSCDPGGELKGPKLPQEKQNTVGTKIIADPEKCFQELISEKLVILLRDGLCLELIIVPVIFRLCSSCRTNYWNWSESD